MAGISVQPTTLENFNRKKLEFSVKAGRQLTADEFILGVLAVLDKIPKENNKETQKEAPKITVKEGKKK